MIRKLLASIALMATGALAFCGDVPVLDSQVKTFTTSSSAGAYCYPQGGQSTAYFQLVSGTSGPVDVTVTNGSGPADTPLIIDKNGAQHNQPFTPSDNEFFRIYWIGGGDKVGVIPDATWLGQTASYRIRCTSTVEGFSPGASGGGNVNIIGPLPLPVQFSPSPGPWPTTNPGGVPLLTYTKPNGSFKLTTGTTTGCQPIFTGSGVLYDIFNSNTAQTVAVGVYDEGAGPTCAAADLIQSPILGQAQVIFFGTFGHPLTSGLAESTLTASLAGPVYIDYSKQQL